MTLTSLKLKDQEGKLKHMNPSNRADSESKSPEREEGENRENLPQQSEGGRDTSEAAAASDDADNDCPIVTSKYTEEKEEAKLNTEVEEEEEQIAKSRVEVTWTEAQKRNAIKLLGEKRIMFVYDYYDGHIPYSTLKTWKKNKISTRKKGSGKKVTNPELEERTYEWFCDARALKYPVSDTTLMTQARAIRDELANECILEDDKETAETLKKLQLNTGWLEKFKRRNKIEKRKTQALCKQPYSKVKAKLDDFFEEFDKKKRGYKALLQHG